MLRVASAHSVFKGLLNALWAGATITMHSKFDVQAVHSALSKKDEITFFTAVPTIYARLAAFEKEQSDGKSYGHLRALISGSSALPSRLKDAFAVPITERYGMTETGIITSNPIGRPSERIGVGKAFPSVTVKAPTAAASTDAADAIGDIYVKGPGLFSGYLRDGRFAPHPEGSFFRTGDQGFLDQESNCLHLCGRDRDIFKVAGFKVAAGEIESALTDHEAVVECAACALPERNEPSSQIIAVMVKVKSSSAAVDASHLRSFLNDRLAYYKVPRKWLLLSAPGEGIPRNLIGKPDIPAIQEMIRRHGCSI